MFALNEKAIVGITQDGSFRGIRGNKDFVKKKSSICITDS
jgi:hypothetical protein